MRGRKDERGNLWQEENRRVGSQREGSEVKEREEDRGGEGGVEGGV